MLDLGCNPGAFLQVACQHLGTPSRGGCIVGIDIHVRTRHPSCLELSRMHGQPPCSRRARPAVAALQPPVVPKAFCDARVRVVQGDALGLSTAQLLGQLPEAGADTRGYHAVLSDMCHSTLGWAVADVARSLRLAWRASELALGLQEPQQQAPWDAGESRPKSAPERVDCSVG